MRVLLTFTLAIAMFSQAPAKNIIPSLELTIKESDSILFSRLVDIATDSKNAIYVIEGTEKTIYKYSEEGQFLKRIGRSGQGPGEFQDPCSICIDSEDFMYVLDSSNRRIEVFDANNIYVRSIKILSFPVGNHKSVAVDKKHNIYVSGYFPNENTVLCKFSSEGDLIKGSNLPIIEYSGLDFDEHGKRMVNQYLTGGSLCIGENNLMFFSYVWPYFIIILSDEGTELSRIKKEADYNWTPFIFRTDEVNGKLFGESTQTLKIFFCDNEHLVNSILVNDWEGNPKRTVSISILKETPDKFFRRKGSFAVLDFYTKAGVFLESVKIDKRIRFLCSDRKGRLLGISFDEDDVPAIVRFFVSGLK